jgi:hypothetical protein
MQHFEKLGAFYLGGEYDAQTRTRLDNVIMYDARDLTTHAVCIGMTGSGKTGLCIDLLEEAALDGVPSIIIDPKGDIANLLLTFPELRPEDFEPWVNLDDARRKNLTVTEYAAHTSKTWRQGLADWGQGPDRIRTLRETADFRIYTPGSDAGLPVSVLASLRAPALSWDENQEMLRERISGTASAVLGLVGADADPLRSREHILLATIFEHFWRRGEDLDLAKLISAIQSPPVRRLGVFDVSTFYPDSDRLDLAMALNNIMASPSFGAWLHGEPLDVARMLYGPAAKPRHNVFYIAHLSEPERMFFVTLLLEQVLTWVRRQSGTTSLRALLYFDEVFGFFPPVATPPSKRPLLTLLKQARAFGLGVVLTTQNPVDLDYKGLTNAGTWFIGRLQAERDKDRVLEGLESASSEVGSAVDRQRLDRVISDLDSRVFLLHNVHEPEPVVFKTRWAMSYLRGPLTRAQVKQLMAETKAEGANAPLAPGAEAAAPRREVARGRPTAPSAPPSEPPPQATAAPPPAPPGVPQVFLPVAVGREEAVESIRETIGQRIESLVEPSLSYASHLLAFGRVSYVDRKRQVDETREVSLLVPARELGTVVRWGEVSDRVTVPDTLREEPEPGATFGSLPAELATAREIKSLARSFSDYLYKEQRLELRYCPPLSLYGRPGESEDQFRIRAQQAAREKRDAAVEKLRRKYRTKLDRLETRLSRERRELEEDRAEYEARKREELISAGETVISLLGIFGRRKSSPVSQAARRRRYTASAKADVAESEAEIVRLQRDIDEMRKELEEEARSIAQEWEDALGEMESYYVKPRRVDVQVDFTGVAWLPSWEIGYRSASGKTVHQYHPAWPVPAVQPGGLPSAPATDSVRTVSSSA